MVNLPDCDQCVHDEVCKISKQLFEIRKKMEDLKLDDEIPAGVSVDLNCSYYKHELTEYVC